MTDGRDPADRPWWRRVADAAAGEPLAAVVVVAAALPVILGAGILALGRRLCGRRRCAR